MPDLRVKIMVYQQDGTVISQYLLGEGEHTIGRDPNSAIYCESAYISNDHAKLHLSDEGIFIEDLKSTSGTFLDQVSVRGKVRLTPGQRIQVGDLHIDLQLEGVGDLSPGVKIGSGRYELMKELGRGAMGQVWLAQDTQLDEKVAIKVLPSDVANDAVCLLDLKREVQKSRKLSHDNIIRIHDLIQLPGENPFVSLEYVEGTDLHAIQANQTDRIFGWEDLKPYVLQLCDALNYAHERKIVHRDLKPANIMVTNEGVLKLADFGIAASIADATGRSSMANVISGTPQFMSPQQMLGESPKASDDIYALGATMYCLLTGRPPFHTGDIAQQSQHITPAPLEQRLKEFGLQNEIPKHVNDVVMSCLAKDSTARPATVGAIGEWLRSEGKSDRPAERKKTETGIERMVAEKPADAAEAESAVEEQPTQERPAQAQPETTGDKKSPVLAIAAAFIVVAALGWAFMGGSGDSEKTTPETPGPLAKKPGQTTPGPIVANDPLGKAIAQNNGDLKKALVQITKGHSQPAKFDRDGNLIFLNLSDDKASGLKISDASLAHLKGPDIHSLTALNIGSANELTDKCLPYLVQLKGLKDLYVGNFLSDQGLQYLAENLPSLTGQVSLAGGYNRNRIGLSAGGLNHLRQGAFKNTRVLTLYNFDFSGKGSLDFLSDLSDLTKLKLQGKVNDSGIDKIAKLCPDLKVLQLFLEGNQTGLTDQALALLKSMSKLEKLELRGSPFSRNALADLRKSLTNCEVTITKASTIDRFKEGLVAYYPFNGNANDESGNENDGEVKGATLAVDRHGKEASAYQFKRSEEANHIEIPNPTDLHESKVKTISAWIQVPNTGYGGGQLIRNYSDDTHGENGWKLAAQGNTKPGPLYIIDERKSRKSRVVKSFKFNEERWYHLVSIDNDNQTKLYLNGREIASQKITAASATKPNTRPLLIGGFMDPTRLQGGFNGKIDDVRIYNRALSAEEVSALYNLEKPSSETTSSKKPGTLLWEFETGREVRSSPSISSDGTIYFGSFDQKVYALESKSGVKKWEFQTDSFVSSSPAIGSDGTIYIGSEDANVYALDGKTGAKLWEFQTEDRANSSPAIGSDGTVYVGSNDQKLYALDSKTGTKIWEFQTGHYVSSSPAIGSDGSVYVGSFDKKIYALDGKTGAKIWEFQAEDFISSSPAIGLDGNIYIASEDKKIYAINGKNGAKIWEFKTENRADSSPAIGSDGTVYVGSDDGKLYALNGKTGVKLWEFQTGGDTFSPAVGNDGTVYIGSIDKKLYALNGKTGVKLWEFVTGGNINCAPAIGSDGIIYIGSDDNKLYAIATSSKGPANSPWPMFGQNARHTGCATYSIEKSVRRLIKKPTGELTPEDYLKVKTWTQEFGSVTHLEPFAALKNLTQLQINRMKLSDLSALAELKNLRHLNLHHNNITDLSPLAELNNLENMFLGYNQINDAQLKHLIGLKNLKRLQLDHNTGLSIEEIDELQKALPNCKITHNANSPEAKAAIEAAIRKAANKPTGELTKADYETVTELGLNNSNISNVDVLAKLTKLKRLHLDFNNISDVSALANLKELTYINLSFNQITDISPLTSLNQLMGLVLRNNRLTREQIVEIQKSLPNCKIE